MYKTNAYYTHQPFLIELINKTTGSVLECGCGDGSTVIMKTALKNTNRKLVSLESNLAWLTKFLHLSDENHELYHVDANNEDCMETGNKWVEFIKEQEFGEFELIFLDSSPWLSRKCCFDYFLNKAKIIVIHDFDYFPNHNIIGRTISVERNGDKEKIECDLSKEVKNYKLLYPPYEFFAGSTGPPTLVCSNLMDKDEFDNLIRHIEQESKKYY